MTSPTRERQARAPPLGPTSPVSPIELARGLGKLSPVTRADFGALTEAMAEQANQQIQENEQRQADQIHRLRDRQVEG